MRKQPSVVHISPTPEAQNPYVHLLARSLERAGAACDVRNRFSLRWYLRSRRSVEILHFHWAEHLCSRSSAGRTAKDFFQLVAGLVYAKSGGCRLVYTAHNLEPHDTQTPLVNLTAHRLVMGLADAIHVHDENALSKLSKRPGVSDRAFLAPHGHYIGVYPNDCSRADARAKLGIADTAFVYLFLGQMRPHKGIEALVEAFRQVSLPDDRLILAGWAPDRTYTRVVQRLTEGISRIMVFPQFVANDRIQSFLNASDICVLPYQKSTTSGAAILALSFGKPVIAPSIGGFPSLLRGGAGILYDIDQVGLSQALIDARKLDLSATGAVALEAAHRLDWDTIALRHLSVYQALVRRRRNGQ